MTTALDTKLRNAAEKLVTALGTNAVFTILASEVYDEEEGETTSVVSAAVTVKVAPPSPFHVGLVDGDNIRSGDLRITLPKALADVAADATTGVVTALVPTVGMKVVMVNDEGVSTTYKIVPSKQPLQSGDDIAAWELQLRPA